ncbi:hypothetical protein [Patulibacter sp. SYSU D01012]|uniref:hypothetical protein n=1 Tax=Patulibacter sp. SYSU D01012 TaxID=2817381 RepID=UPI001B313DF7|nr:hypothetical protein [Patulibacter sp. SYSU D01012]
MPHRPVPDRPCRPAASAPGPRAERRAAAVALAVLLAVAPGAAADEAPDAGDPLPDEVVPGLIARDAPIYDTLDARWNPPADAYGSLPGPPTTRTNAALLRLHVRAAQGDGPRSFVDDRRVADLVGMLTRPPAFRDGAYTRYRRDDPDQRHRPGFTAVAGSSRTAGGAQHVSLDPEVALALAETYRAADVVHLPDDLRRRIRHVVLRVAAHRMFSPREVRIGQLLWTAEMLWAKRLVDGDVAAWRRDYRRALDTQRALLPRLLTRDAGYRYTPGDPAAVINRMDTPEYSLIALGGAQWLPQALRAGMPVGAAERARYRAWLRRVIWGAFGNDGGLNWDTGWGARRRYLAQYWGWAAVQLSDLARMPGFLPRADRLRARDLCARVARRYLEVADADGVLPKTLYGTHSAFAEAGRDRAIGTLRVLSAATRCPDPQGARDPASAASFDRDQGRYAVTTQRYTTSVVAWARDTAAGVLPVRLVDDHGLPVGGLGGRRSAFDLRAGALRLGGAAQAGTTVRLRARGGSGPLAGRSTLHATVRRGGRTATVRTTFADAGFRLRGRLDRAAPRRWRLPVPVGARARWERRGGATVVHVTPAAGRRWTATLRGRGTVRLAGVPRDDRDPTVRRVAVVTLPAGREVDLRVTVGAPVS